MLSAAGGHREEKEPCSGTPPPPDRDRCAQGRSEFHTGFEDLDLSKWTRMKKSFQGREHNEQTVIAEVRVAQCDSSLRRM